MALNSIFRRCRRIALTAVFSTALLATASPSWSQPPAVAAASAPVQLPGVYRLGLGDFQVSSLSDGTVPQDLHTLLTGTTTAEVSTSTRRDPVSMRKALMDASTGF